EAHPRDDEYERGELHRRPREPRADPMLVTGPLHGDMFRTNAGKLREETLGPPRIGGVKSPAWAAASVGTSAAFGVALAAAALAVLFRAMSPPAFSISAASAIAASGALAVLAWRAPRVAIGAAIGVTFGLLPNEIYGCVNALTAPLATMTGPEGSGDFGVFFVGAVIVFLGCVAALPIAALVSAVGRRAPAGFIAVAAAATLASMLVTAFGLASMRRPEPDDLVDVFDDNAQVEVGEHATVGGTTLSYERTREGLRPLRPGDDIGWGVGPDGQPVQLLPTGEMCILHLSGDTATTEVALNPTIDAQCPQLGVYHDKRSGAGIVVAFGVAFASSSGKSSMGRPLAIFGPQGERREIRVGDVAGELGAPRAWTFGGCVGLVLAILAVAAAIVARHAGRMLDGGVDATH